MGDYHNDFAARDALAPEWSDQEVRMPLREIVRLYVHEATSNASLDGELSTARADLEEMRKRWLDEYNRRENAEAERDMLAARVRELEGGEHGDMRPDSGR